jgi:hypothetical protein
MDAHRPPRRFERSAPTVEALSRRTNCLFLLARDQNFTTIIMEISEANRSGGAAAPASSALVGVHSLLSSEQEPPITADSILHLEQEPPIVSNLADAVIDVGKLKHGVEQAGFMALTSEEFRLLAVKLHLSLNLKVLNISGNDMSNAGAGMLAEPLGKLTALQQLNLACTFFRNLGRGPGV